MKILLDQNISRRLRPLLKGHLIMSAQSLGWDPLNDPELLRIAEANGFSLIIAGDRGFVDLLKRTQTAVALLFVNPNDWQTLRDNIEHIRVALATVRPGEATLSSFGETPEPGR